MTVYLLFKSNPNFKVVDDNMNQVGTAPPELIDVFASMEAAEKAKQTCESNMQHNINEFDCDPEEYTIKAQKLMYSPYE